MSNLPTGTVTLLFTDIEGSTRLLQQLGDRYASVLEDCRQLIRTAIARWNGYEVDTQGDSFFIVFAHANDALLAALDIQRALKNHAWEEGVMVRARIGMHTCKPQMSHDNYIGASESLISLARVLTSQGDQDLARYLYEESFQLLQEIHYREFFPLCLENLAGVVAGQGEQEWVTRLWGAAEALRETVGNPIPPLYLLEYQQAVAVAREQLGQESFCFSMGTWPCYDP